MLYQMHRQFKDGTLEFIAQKNINSQDKMKAWTKDVGERHPPPEDAIWMICNEKSEDFMMATTP